MEKINTIPVVNVKGRNAKDITAVLKSGAWTGSRCLIIGGGSSLACFPYHDLIKNELTIGVNKAFTKFKVLVNYGMDPKFYDELTYSDGKDKEQAILHQQWLNFDGIKLFLRHDDNFHFNGVYTVRSLPNKAISYDLTAGIWPATNSGFGALMLAIALGCNRIGLLGYDMKIDREHNKTHWHNGYKGQNIESFNRRLDRFKRDFEEFADVIGKEGITVANLYKGSALSCFPFIDIEEFLKI